jgi:HlyD family secretion protein
MTRGRKYWIGGGAAILAVALGAVGFIRRQAGETVKVEVETLRRRPLVSLVTASGEIQPVKSVDVNANVEGTIEKIAVKEGQTVRQGDFLLRIDPVSAAEAAEAQGHLVQSLRDELQALRVELEQAGRDLDTARQLAAKEMLSREELRRTESGEAQARARVAAAQARVAEAEAALRSSRHELSKVTVTAPASGVITRLPVEEGERASATFDPTLLLTIADLSTMEADIEVDETDVVSVKLGQPAKVTVDAFPDTSFSGKVTEVGTSPIVEEGAAQEQSEEVKDFKVVVTLDQPLPAARMGLSATADIETARRESSVALPIQALVVREQPRPTIGEAPADTLEPGEETEGVFVVRDGKARFTPLRVGITGDRFFEVLSGVQAGDTVVSGSYEALRDLQDGDDVKIEKPDEKKGRRSSPRPEKREA